MNQTCIRQTEKQMNKINDMYPHKNIRAMIQKNDKVPEKSIQENDHGHH